MRLLRGPPPHTLRGCDRAWALSVPSATTFPRVNPEAAQRTHTGHCGSESSAAQRPPRGHREGPHLVQRRSCRILRVALMAGGSFF